jgi:hypothetical protein
LFAGLNREFTGPLKELATTLHDVMAADDGEYDCISRDDFASEFDDVHSVTVLGVAATALCNITPAVTGHERQALISEAA